MADRTIPDRRQRSKELSASDWQVAQAVAYARRLRPPMKTFAYELRLALDRKSLSRQAVYQWEAAKVRTPGSVLVAAARISGLSVDELLRRAERARPTDLVNP